MKIILYLEKNYTLFGNLSVATLLNVINLLYTHLIILILLLFFGGTLQ